MSKLIEIFGSFNEGVGLKEDLTKLNVDASLCIGQLKNTDRKVLSKMLSKESDRFIQIVDTVRLSISALVPFYQQFEVSEAVFSSYQGSYEGDIKGYEDDNDIDSGVLHLNRSVYELYLKMQYTKPEILAILIDQQLEQEIIKNILVSLVKVDTILANTVPDINESRLENPTVRNTVPASKPRNKREKVKDSVPVRLNGGLSEDFFHHFLTENHGDDQNLKVITPQQFRFLTFLLKQEAPISPANMARGMGIVGPNINGKTGPGSVVVISNIRAAIIKINLHLQRKGIKRELILQKHFPGGSGKQKMVEYTLQLSQ